MAKVVIRSFSRFYDRLTKTEFAPVLDRQSGCYVGYADVEDVSPFESRSSFEILTDQEWLDMTTVKPKPVPTAPVTGDPLADAALPKNAAKAKPPAPPASK